MKDDPTDTLVKNIKEKHTACITGPFGSCTYQHLSSKPLLLIAGGTGLSQAKAIIEQAIEAKQTLPIRLYWATRLHDESLASQWFLAWKKKLPQFRAFATNRDDRLTSLMAALEKDSAELSSFNTILSGPQGMVDQLSNQLRELGVPKVRIYADWFSHELALA